MSKASIRNVGDLMTGDLVALGLLDSMDRASTVLTESDLHAVPIIAEDKAFGMVTLADCWGRDPDDLLGDVTSGPALTIDVQATVAEAAALMRSEFVHHLLVTEGRDELVVGMLSSFDLLAMLVE